MESGLQFKSREKRFSLSLKNIDQNTYRAYKNVNKDHEGK